MKISDISFIVKPFLCGLTAGMILVHGVYFYHYTGSLGLDSAYLIGQALAQGLPAIFIVTAGALITLGVTVTTIFFIKGKSARAIILTAQTKADLILHEADNRLTETSARHHQLESLENTRKQMYSDKTDKWLVELENLRKKNQELSVTIASLKTALREKKKSIIEI